MKDLSTVSPGLVTGSILARRLARLFASRVGHQAVLEHLQRPGRIFSCRLTLYGSACSRTDTRICPAYVGLSLMFAVAFTFSISIRALTRYLYQKSQPHQRRALRSLVATLHESTARHHM